MHAHVHAPTRRTAVACSTAGEQQLLPTQRHSRSRVPQAWLQRAGIVDSQASASWVFKRKSLLAASSYLRYSSVGGTNSPSMIWMSCH